MRVLSCFDGISVAQLALKQANIAVSKYVASEIHKPSIKVTQHNFPETIQVGNVNNLQVEQGEFDLLFAGFPCQSFSRSGAQQGFDDPRGKLFFKTLEIYKALKPKYYLFENVVMQAKYRDFISEQIGVEPIEVNSNAYVAQSRRRLYWTNLPYSFTEPEYKVGFNELTGGYPGAYRGYKQADGSWKCSIDPGKKDECGTLTTAGMTAIVTEQKIERRTIANEVNWRKLSGIESAVLQGMPPLYASVVSSAEQRKLYGNSWTLPVICDFVKNIK